MNDEQQKMIAKNDYDISHVIYTDHPRKLQTVWRNDVNKYKINWAKNIVPNLDQEDQAHPTRRIKGDHWTSWLSWCC